MREPRTNHTVVFKTKVANAALKGDKTLSELSEHSICIRQNRGMEIAHAGARQQYIRHDGGVLGGDLPRDFLGRFELKNDSLAGGIVASFELD